eukprot:4949245-Pyramimonas_sp.AAC.1
MAPENLILLVPLPPSIPSSSASTTTYSVFKHMWIERSVASARFLASHAPPLHVALRGRQG